MDNDPDKDDKDIEASLAKFQDELTDQISK